jgi:hypothetical protein
MLGDSMRAIIMADGAGDRWLSSVRGTEYQGLPKQLIQLNGQSLLERTVGLLYGFGHRDVWITSHDSRMEVPGAKRYEPENNEHCLDKLQACKPIWDTKYGTMFLYGDVYYTADAIAKITKIPVKDKFLFFGRMNVSYYSQHGHEIFCKKIEDFDYLEECINWVKFHLPNYGGGWELYRRMCLGVTEAERLKLHIPYDHFISIDDWTEDFDEYAIYQDWWRGITNGA